MMGKGIGGFKIGADDQWVFWETFFGIQVYAGKWGKLFKWVDNGIVLEPEFLKWVK